MPEQDNSLGTLSELLEILADIQRRAEKRAEEILMERGGK